MPVFLAEHPTAGALLVDGAEWRAARAGGFPQGYRRRHFDQPFDWRPLDYAAADVRGHAAFERSLDLFGDGSVRLLWTPGHTLGHQSILLALAGRDLLLTGDAAYTRRTIDDDLVPIFVADQRLYLRSLTAIRDHLRRAPDTVVICGHDAQRWQRLEPIYA